MPKTFGLAGEEEGREFQISVSGIPKIQNPKKNRLHTCFSVNSPSLSLLGSPVSSPSLPLSLFCVVLNFAHHKTTQSHQRPLPHHRSLRLCVPNSLCVCTCMRA